jgi:hypothetical protein
MLNNLLLPERLDKGSRLFLILLLQGLKEAGKTGLGNRFNFPHRHNSRNGVYNKPLGLEGVAVYSTTPSNKKPSLENFCIK